MELPDDFRTAENQLIVRQLTKKLDRVVFPEADATQKELEMVIAVLAATTSEALRRLALIGGDSRRVLKKVVSLLETAS